MRLWMMGLAITGVSLLPMTVEPGYSSDVGAEPSFENSRPTHDKFIKALIASLVWLHKAAVRFEPLEGKKEINLSDLVSVASDSTSDMEKAGGLIAPYLQISNGEERAAALKMHEAIRLLEQRCDEAVQLAEERVAGRLASRCEGFERSRACSRAAIEHARADATMTGNP